MEEKMESENSYSGESSSSSETSSGSSDTEEEVTEPVRILGRSLDLPQDLCEDYTIFKEFFSLKTWNTLEDKHKDQLMEYLPDFSDNDKEEKDITVKMLFDHEPFHFTSPLGDFYNNLRQGNFRPDIAKMRKFLKKARAKQQRHKIKSYYAKLMPEILITRERILAAVRAAPPGPMPYLPPLPLKPSTKNNLKPVYIRARQRYFEELSAIRSEVGGQVSEDDNYPEGPPQQLLRKRKQNNSGQNVDSNVTGTLGGCDSSQSTSLDCLKNVLAAHRARRQYRENHPELNISGITLDDIKQRVALVNGAKKLMFGGQKSEAPITKLKRGPKKEPSQKQNKDVKPVVKKAKEEEISIDHKALLPHIKIKCEQESDSETSSFVDPITSPKQPKSTELDIKQEMDVDYLESPKYEKIETLIKQEPQDQVNVSLNSGKGHQPVPIKIEDLDGIDMMALPVDLANDSGEVLDTEWWEGIEELTRSTHPSFLSLVRALFPARAAHRASRAQLHARLAAVLRAPRVTHNAWYSLSDDWRAELDSALEFLAGERGPHPDDFVPYLQFISETQMYQWIGAGRDCDALLGRLAERWRRAAPPRALPAPAKQTHKHRYQTTWCVRPPTSSELAEFRSQERRRFSAATKPFTYIQHGYRAVVGPCAWWGGADGGAGAGAVLAPARPRHAGLAALVRDAAARLPNGEGTRNHILTLLKMSQWIVSSNERLLQAALTATLDKLHGAKRDPVLKYDHNTGLWIYLHRHRSEEDWLKLANGRGRGKLVPPAPLPAAPRPPSPAEVQELEVSNVEEVIEDGTDSDVDVEESAESRGPQLSSAQLLMRAQHRATHNKPPKHKPIKTQKQANLMAQSAKLANLIALSKPNQKQNSPTKPLNQPPKLTQITKQNVPAKETINQPEVPKVTPKQIVTKSVTTPKQSKPTSVTKGNTQTTSKVTVVKTNPPVSVSKQAVTPSKPVNVQVVTQVPKSSPSLVATPHVSPLLKQRPLLKPESPQTQHTNVSAQNSLPTVVQTPPAAVVQNQKLNLVQGTRSLLIRPSAIQTTATATVSPTTLVNQALSNPRRGVVRVLSPATPSSGKSLISPRALMQQNTPTSKKRPSIPAAPLLNTLAQTTANATTVVSSVPTVVTSSITTRTVQLPGGRTVQLANQTVHLPGGQAVQISPGHTLQLSSLQLPTHSVRLPSGQTVQLASPQAIQAVRAVTSVKNPIPRAPSSPIIKANPLTTHAVQIPVSSVQLAGQTVQIGGQSVQLTGHTVKLPSGQSVQVASQSVQLPSGQTVQLAQLGNQSVQLPSAQNIQMSGGSVLGSQTVQIGGQTVQLSGQTLQLSTGQTVQLSSGQTLQLASGQTVQLAGQQGKSMTQVVRAQTADKTNQPLVAKLLTNAQQQMVSGVRVLAPARPLLLTAAKPLHNIILQQSDGSTIRVTSSGGVTPSQTLVLSNLGAQSTTTTSTPPILKLQQVTPLQQVKLPQGIKIQQGGAGSSASPGVNAVRSVLMDGQQLKLVGGRHVLARLLRPAHPPQ